MALEAVGASSHVMIAASSSSFAAVDWALMLHLHPSNGVGTGRRKREWAVRPPGRRRAAMPDIATANPMRPAMRT
eukprot:6235816-Pyramimonas_sp.AAC.1